MPNPVRDHHAQRLDAWYQDRAAWITKRHLEVEAALRAVALARAATLLVGPIAARLEHEHVTSVRRLASAMERLHESGRWFQELAARGDRPDRALQRQAFARETSYRVTPVARLAATAYRRGGQAAPIEPVGADGGAVGQPPDPAMVRQVDNEQVRDFAGVLEQAAQVLQTVLSGCSRMKVDVPPWVPARERQLHVVRLESARRNLLEAIRGFRRSATDLRRRANRMEVPDQHHYDPGVPGAGIIDADQLAAITKAGTEVVIDAAALAAGQEALRRWSLVVLARMERLQRVLPILTSDAAGNVVAAAAGRPWPPVTAATELAHWEQRLATGPYEVPTSLADHGRRPDPISGELIGDREHWRRYGRPSMPLEDYQRLHDRLGGGPYEPAANFTFAGGAMVDPITGESISAEEHFRRYGPEDPPPADDWSPDGADPVDGRPPVVADEAAIDPAVDAEQGGSGPSIDPYATSEEVGGLESSGGAVSDGMASAYEETWAPDASAEVDAGDPATSGDRASLAAAGGPEDPETGGFELPWQVLAVAGVVGAGGAGVGLRVHRQRAARQVRDWVTYKHARAKAMAATSAGADEHDG